MLFFHAFAGIASAVLEKDQAFRQRQHEWATLGPRSRRRFDRSAASSRESLASARQSLAAVRAAATPSEKLRHMGAAVNAISNSRASTDDLLQLLICALLTSEIRSPNAEVGFVVEYAHQETDGVGSAGYSLATFQAAVEAISSLEIDVLFATDEASPAADGPQSSRVGPQTLSPLQLEVLSAMATIPGPIISEPMPPPPSTSIGLVAAATPLVPTLPASTPACAPASSSLIHLAGVASHAGGTQSPAHVQCMSSSSVEPVETEEAEQRAVVGAREMSGTLVHTNGTAGPPLATTSGYASMSGTSIKLSSSERSVVPPSAQDHSSDINEPWSVKVLSEVDSNTDSDGNGYSSV